MDAPAALLVIRWLVRDTFRQARATGIFWLMLGVSVICIALCLSTAIEGYVPLEDEGALPRATLNGANVAVAGVVANGFSQSLGIAQFPVVLGQGKSKVVPKLPTRPLRPEMPLPSPPPPPSQRVLYADDYQQVEIALKTGVPIYGGDITLAFGAVTIDAARGRKHAVHSIECVLAGWVADAAGVLLALVFTAGFLPSFLEPSAISVLLAKPVPRWSLFVGKYLGVLVFVTVQILIFVGGTWLALALRTSVWDPSYFLCLPLLMLHFAVFFSFSAMLAVLSRSTVVCVFGSILFWLMCWGMNYGRHIFMEGITGLDKLAPAFRFIIELGYWVLPKPLDNHVILVQTLKADDLFSHVIDTNVLMAQNAWHPGLSVMASLLTGVVLLGIAACEFSRSDY